MNGPVDAAKPVAPAAPVRRGAHAALLLLVLINLFNYIDRQVLAAVEPEIRADLLAGVPEEEAGFKMGLLATAFLVSYMLIAPVFGVLADRSSRWLLVSLGVLVWTLASGASGLPWTDWGVAVSLAFWLLLATRCFVGVGEAAYGPVAPAMIADLYPVQKRGLVLAFFYLAIPVGGALGYSLGEFVLKVLHQSWHWAFLYVVPPGILLGAWCFLMRDPPRGHSDQGAVAASRPTLANYLKVLRIPSYTLNTVGMTFMTFAIGGLAFWMADFLKQHEEAGQPMEVGPIGPRTFFGILTALAGLLSTLAGGIAGDMLRARYSGSYFIVSGLALIVGFPMVLGVVFVPFPWAWLFVFAAVFCLFFNTGPSNTILANVTHPSVRASAYALNILIIHLFGDVVSPPLIGWIKGIWGLDTGFILVSAAMLLGGVAWLCGAGYLEEDTRLAPTRV